MATIGYVIYEGPSRLTGDPIVAILSTRSVNTKVELLEIVDQEERRTLASPGALDVEREVFVGFLFLQSFLHQAGDQLPHRVDR